MKRLALILALVLLLAACAELPPPAETAPSLTTVPTETTSPAVVTDFSEYEALLDPNGDGRNWLFLAMGCVFETPKDIPLDYLFYLGLDHGSWDSISPESEEYLIEQGFLREMDLQPMPAAELDEILRSNFGVALSDCTIPQSWCYLETEDFYCSNNNDAFFPSPFTITAVEDDGKTVRIHYHVDDYFYNTATGEFLENADMIYSLERQEDGTYHAVFNIPAP